MVARIAAAHLVVHESPLHVLEIDLYGAHVLLLGVELVGEPARVEPPMDARLTHRLEAHRAASPAAPHADIVLRLQPAAPQSGGKRQYDP